MFGIYGTSDEALILASALALKGKEVFIYAAEEEELEEITDGHLKNFLSPIDHIFKEADESGKLSYSGNIQTLLNCELIFMSSRIVKGETDPESAMRFVNQNVLSVLRKAVDSRKEADSLNIVLIDTLPYKGLEVLFNTILNTKFEVGDNYLEDDKTDAQILPVKYEGDQPIGLNVNIAYSPLIVPNGGLLNYVKKPQEAVIGTYSDELIGRLKEVYKLLKVPKKQIFVSTPQAVDDALILKDAYQLILQTFVNEAFNMTNSDLVYSLIKNVKLPDPSFQIDSQVIERLQGLDTLSGEINLYNATIKLALEEIKNKNENTIETFVKYFTGKNPEEIVLAITGIAQRPGSGDMRGAQVIDLINGLAEKGFKIRIFQKEGTTDLKWRLREHNDNITYCKDFYSAVKDANALLVLGKVGQSIDLKRVLKNMKGDPVLYDPLSLLKNRKDLDSFIQI